MNTDNLIPISFVKKFTPLVIDDVIFDTRTGEEYTIRSESSGFNQAYDGDDNIFLVSFADRPNAGEQPVGDDVVVDAEYYDGGYHPDQQARHFEWDDEGIKSWKPSRDPLLAKFKSEQGANMNNFTFENTEDATHYAIYPNDNYGQMHIVKGGEGYEYSNNETQYKWKLSGANLKNEVSGIGELIELSRPIGERKEDHTVNGVLTKAQPQGAKAYEVALMIVALDDNPDEHVNDIENTDVRSTQTIEPWLYNSVGKWCVDKFGAVADDKPVFTQEKLDYRPWDGKESLDIGMGYADGGGVDCMFIGIHAGIIIGRPMDMSCHNKLYLSTSDGSFCKPIDNRTAEEKIFDELTRIFEPPGAYDYDVRPSVSAALKSDIITIKLKE